MRKNIVNLSMLLMLFWTLTSILAAFAGAARSKAFFNSTPLAIFWCVLLVFLVAGFFVYPAIRRRTSLCLMHIGCCLVLAGGLWGSNLSHKLFFKQDLPTGRMLLQEGEHSPLIFDERFTFHRKLPFTVELAKTWVEYYDPEGSRSPGMVKAYKSTLRIYDDDQLCKEATIRVNKPLYYKGFHFYQHTFGTHQGRPYSGFLVTSARGVVLVFGGYGFIFAGLVFHFWLGVLRRHPVKEIGT